MRRRRPIYPWGPSINDVCNIFLVFHPLPQPSSTTHATYSCLSVKFANFSTHLSIPLIANVIYGWTPSLPSTDSWLKLWLISGSARLLRLNSSSIFSSPSAFAGWLVGTFVLGRLRGPFLRMYRCKFVGRHADLKRKIVIHLYCLHSFAVIHKTHSDWSKPFVKRDPFSSIWVLCILPFKRWQNLCKDLQPFSPSNINFSKTSIVIVEAIPGKGSRLLSEK